jgi:hypothetical protein
VQPGTLFDPAYDEVEIVPMDRVDREFRLALAPGRDMLDRLPPDSPLGSFTYRAGMPYTVDLMISLYRDNTPFLLRTTSSPTTAETCRNFMIIAHVNGDQPDSDAVLPDLHLSARIRRNTSKSTGFAPCSPPRKTKPLPALGRIRPWAG